MNGMSPMIDDRPARVRSAFRAAHAAYARYAAHAVYAAHAAYAPSEEQ